MELQYTIWLSVFVWFYDPEEQYRETISSKDTLSTEIPLTAVLWLCGSFAVLQCVLSLKPVLYFQQKNKDKCLFHHVTLTGYPPTHSYACEHTHTHKQHNEKHGKLCQVGPATTYKPHVYADILCFWMTVMGLC